MSTFHPLDSRSWMGSSRAELAALAGEPPPRTQDDYRSYELAASITTVEGEPQALVTRCLMAFSKVPYGHLRFFAARGGGILFAETIPVALESSTATARRPRSLSADEFLALRMDYDKGSRTVAVYDRATDLVVFPTSYTTREPTRPVLHEVGHALTLPRAVPREALVAGLPEEIAAYVRDCVPDDASPAEQLRVATEEALAEGYVYLATDRASALPAPLLEELAFILRTTIKGQTLAFDFEEDLWTT